MKLVSVIIPIYNVEKYLRECINSVINQTYKNIEIILVNDGSPDNSDLICQEYVQKYDFIKYVSQKNQGVSAARNTGIKHAHGAYIYFLDSDDYIDNEFIETSVHIAETNNSDIVRVATNVTKGKSIINLDFVGAATWELFIKKEYLDKYPDLHFDTDLKMHEDLIFYHQLLSLTFNVNTNYNAKYYYRQHNSQATSQNKYTGKIIKELEILSEFYDKYKLWGKREYFVSIFITTLIGSYWRLGVSEPKDKEIFFNAIHDFIILHKLSLFKTYKFTLTNFMARKFISCKNWKQFEKYLILIKLFKYVKTKLKMGLYNV